MPGHLAAVGGMRDRTDIDSSFTAVREVRFEKKTANEDEALTLWHVQWRFVQAAEVMCCVSLWTSQKEGGQWGNSEVMACLYWVEVFLVRFSKRLACWMLDICLLQGQIWEQKHENEDIADFSPAALDVLTANCRKESWLCAFSCKSSLD